MGLIASKRLTPGFPDKPISFLSTDKTGQEYEGCTERCNSRLRGDLGSAMASTMAHRTASFSTDAGHHPCLQMGVQSTSSNASPGIARQRPRFTRFAHDQRLAGRNGPAECDSGFPHCAAEGALRRKLRASYMKQSKDALVNVGITQRPPIYELIRPLAGAASATWDL